MNETVPRPEALEYLGKEHDHVLQLCSRIREGLNRKVETARIRSYAEWFKENYLEPHFHIEEQVVFPVLGTNVRVKRALANHRRINRLLNCSCEDLKVLNLLEEELSRHIRFEERILYREIEKVATPQKLAEIEMQHQGIPFSDSEWKDTFWLG